MKLLIYDWAAWFRDDLYDVLRKLNIEYKLIKWKFDNDLHNKNNDESFVDYFDKSVDTTGFDAVFSINYWPMISVACEKKGIKYISWSYDSPIDIENPEETFGNSCNYIFLYDRFEAEKYIEAGYRNVYHMPLGINFERFEKYSSSMKKCDPYRAEVSFVGGLYNNSFNEVSSCLDDNAKSVLQKIVEFQLNMGPSQYVIDQLLTEGLVTLIGNEIAVATGKTANITRKHIEYMLAQEITRRERIIILNMCGGRFNTNLYSGQTFDILKDVNQKSTVDYFTQMPLVFAGSKINLNPASYAIRSGVSLRAFDVLACGGFLLSSYKSENKDDFEIGKEMDEYISIGEAIEKIEFYLQHDELRESIAKAGRERVRRDHNMKDRLLDMFKIAGI